MTPLLVRRLKLAGVFCWATLQAWLIATAHYGIRFATIVTIVTVLVLALEILGYWRWMPDAKPHA